jgi:hypothetical protein
MYETIIYELKMIYINTNFKFIESECFIEILHDNKKYMNDNNFDNKIYEICSKYLSENDLYKLGVSYDFNNKLIIQ